VAAYLLQVSEKIDYFSGSRVSSSILTKKNSGSNSDFSTRTCNAYLSERHAAKTSLSPPSVRSEAVH